MYFVGNLLNFDDGDFIVPSPGHTCIMLSTVRLFVHLVPNM